MSGWGGATIGGGSALGNCCGNMSGGHSNATTATVGHAKINPFLVTLVVRRGDRRGSGRWCVYSNAAPHGLDGGVLTGDGVVPSFCWLLCTSWKK